MNRLTATEARKIADSKVNNHPELVDLALHIIKKAAEAEKYSISDFYSAFLSAAGMKELDNKVAAYIEQELTKLGFKVSESPDMDNIYYTTVSW